MRLTIKPKYYLFCIAAFALSGCAGFSSSSYSCNDLKPWMESVKRLSGGKNLNNVATNKMAYLLSPAFNDEVFKPTFGKPYLQLNKKERNGINNSLVKCFPEPWVTVGLRVPFQPSNENKNLQPLWQHAISKANNISFETTLAQREQQIAIREESVKKYNEQQRQAQIIYAEKYKKDNENLKNTITGLAAIIVGGAIISDSRRNNSEDYSQYGDCAPKLKERLARCNVSSGECSMIGCSSKTDCFKGLAGRSCEFILNTYGRTYKTYYCDTNTSDYDTDRETVINKICEK